MAKRASLIPPERVERAILAIRGHRVLLDRDLAELYGVETRTLVQAMKRNLPRFPADFMFQLTQDEFANWRSQIVISNSSLRMSLRRRPYAFTEQGVAMLSGVLNSPRAVEVNIAIMRTFVRLRQLMLDNRDLARKIEELEKKYDAQFQVVFDAIRELVQPPDPVVKPRIGFRTKG